MSLQETSPEARQCSLLYKPTRDSLLRAAHWDCARAEIYLTLLKAASGTLEYTGPQTVTWNPTYQPPPPWLYSYAYPSDCLLVRSILPVTNNNGVTIGGLPIFPTSAAVSGIPSLYETRRQKFSIGSDVDANGNPNKVILCNQSQAVAVYTRRVVNPDLWESLLEEAMVASLALQLARPLTGNKDIIKEKRDYAMSAILQARARDGNEGTHQENWTPDWIAVRGVAADYATGTVGVTSWETPSFLLI